MTICRFRLRRLQQPPRQELPLVRLPTPPNISPTTGTAMTSIGQAQVYGRGGAHPVAVPPSAPKPAPMVVTTRDGKKLTLIGRRVEFGESVEGKQEFAAFITAINAKKIESKTVPASHELDYLDSLTIQGKIIMLSLFGLAAILGLCIMNMAQRVERPGKSASAGRGEQSDPASAQHRRRHGRC